MKKTFISLGIALVSVVALASCGKKNADTLPENTTTDTTTTTEAHTHVFDQKNTAEKYLKTAATCTNKAVYYYSCTDGEKGTETFEYGEALGHDYHENNDGVNESCSTAGRGNSQSCSRCDSVIPGDVIEPSAHTFTVKTESEEYFAHAATCTEGASYYYSCEVCGEKDLEHTYTVGVGTGHDYHEVDDYVVATCQNAGHTKSQACRNCDSVIPGEEIPQKEHIFVLDGHCIQYKCELNDYQSLTLNREVSTKSFEVGKEYVYSLTLSVGKYELSYSGSAQKINLYDKDGVKFYQGAAGLVDITTSGTYYLSFVKVEGNTGFTFGPHIHQDSTLVISDKYLVQSATCTSPAYYAYSCHFDGEKSNNVTAYGEPLGHNYQLNEDGTKIVCTRCGVTKGEEITEETHICPIEGHCIIEGCDLNDYKNYAVGTKFDRFAKGEFRYYKVYLEPGFYVFGYDGSPDYGTVYDFDGNIIIEDSSSDSFEITIAGTYYVKQESGSAANFYLLSHPTHRNNCRVVEDKYLKQAATCTTPAIYYYSCDADGYASTSTFEVGEPCHTYEKNGDYLAPTDTEYGHEESSTCIYCGAYKEGTRIPKTGREYTIMNTDSKYLAQAATCVSKARYYYSSADGEMGTETFEYGEYAEHTLIDGVCIIDGCSENTFVVFNGPSYSSGHVSKDDFTTPKTYVCVALDPNWEYALGNGWQYPNFTVYNSKGEVIYSGKDNFKVPTYDTYYIVVDVTTPGETGLSNYFYIIVRSYKTEE